MEYKLLEEKDLELILDFVDELIIDIKSLLCYIVFN